MIISIAINYIAYFIAFALVLRDELITICVIIVCSYFWHLDLRFLNCSKSVKLCYYLLLVIDFVNRS